jgi:excisionase family DNA binding protein
MGMSTRSHATPQYVTCKQLAAMLGVKPDTVRHWAKSGLVPYLRVGEQTLRFDPEAVIAALSAGLPTPPDRRDYLAAHQMEVRQ